METKQERVDSLELVKEFHLTFNHPVKEFPDISNTALNMFRVGLINEELGELAEALKNGDKVKAFDALCDLEVVVNGAFLALGFYRAKSAGMVEVHLSNMSKLGSDGNPIYREDGKILKGPNFRLPDFDKVLKQVF